MIIFRLQCNGMTYSNFVKLVGYLNADSCPVVNAFFDWNPIYTDDYAPGKEQTLFANSEDAQNEENVNPWKLL